MATLPPSPFTSSAECNSAETLVVARSPQAYVAAISGPFDSGVPSAFPPDEAAADASSQAPAVAADIPDDLKHRMLAAIEEDYRFSLNKEKFLFDIGCVPEDFEKYIALVDQLTDTDEPPIFIQEAMRA